MKKLLSLALVGTMFTAVSCGNDTASNGNLKSARTSVYDTQTTRVNDTNYVPGTYSANRVKYYDGMYNDTTYTGVYDNTYTNGTYNNGYTNNAYVNNGYTNNAYTNGTLNKGYTNNTYDNTYGTGSNYMYNYNAGKTNTTLDTANNTYKDVRNTTSARYIQNPYMQTNNAYSNAMYNDLSKNDFNNGLVTYDHNLDTANNTVAKNTSNVLNKSTVNNKALTTNALNTKSTANSYIVKGTDVNTTKTVNNDMNRVDYDVNTTYEQVKDTTKELVDDISTDAKAVVRNAKNDIKVTTNQLEY